MNLIVPQEAWDFWNNWGTVSFSRKILLLGISRLVATSDITQR
jgi:hypothetical protein